ncbi:MAG: hypothetical protein LBL55_12015 [Propionibacteriaceae bacterium]|jgi:hypothetical protein|nr:hypothetical protein [Propionibacteriaceae bacterium]
MIDHTQQESQPKSGGVVRLATSALALGLLMTSLTGAEAQAQTVYEYGKNKFTTTEYVDIRYEGYGQVSGDTYYGNQYTVAGAIRYKRGDEDLTGWQWTPGAQPHDPTLRTVSVGVWDTLDPDAPVTKFSYDLLKERIGV